MNTYKPIVITEQDKKMFKYRSELLRQWQKEVVDNMRISLDNLFNKGDNGTYEP